MQKQLLDETAFGRQLKESVGEIEAATKVLQEEGQSLNREKLLDFVLEAQNDARIRAYVQLARAGMDYIFFQNLTETIEKATPEEKARLEGIREKLLFFTSEVDKQLEARFKQATDFVEKLLNQEDVEKATRESIGLYSGLCGSGEPAFASGFRGERLHAHGQTTKDGGSVARGFDSARSGSS